ncbi:hypothetical protein [Bizionia paragorgiae]|jgi:hypothetical protein|uniref:Uncharacterized protein n=1 Tax=Bizionia paragorgiae TaxID=283786 RepID=A0A1H4A8D3_BIZPA|nr:hypothetical protein [Bizionia paragorgiae]MDX1270925.1 hypothetical protein [Bizionia paragorgiae]SEA31724.1 hypothetical protein SAMN04487990_11034 [Bizionia paragorgiae]
MQQVKQHISIKLLALALVFAVAIPTVVKFVHIFEDHKHEVCTGEKETHIHEIDIDCEFYKFKLNQVFSVEFENLVYLPKVENFKVSSIQYFFISDYQRLPFSLRGPPQLV